MALRRGRGGAPAREVTTLHVIVHAEDRATAVAWTLRPDGTRGLQTRVWVRGADEWRVAVAHVSAGAPPSAPGAADDDVATSRVVGGPLDGLRIAVKDVIAVAGQRLGHGNPVHLRGHAVTAPLLLIAGWALGAVVTVAGVHPRSRDAAGA